MKAKHCDECKFLKWIIDHSKGFQTKGVCEKGHKLRFYKEPFHPHYGPDGYKRRCDDFVIKE